ncbi:hypothetical protein [Priestia megaterium]
MAKLNMLEKQSKNSKKSKITQSIPLIKFFTPSVDQIRNEVAGIDRCYTSQTDIVGEGVQNSIDEILSCIRNMTLKTGECTIKINAKEREISIIDNGYGLGNNATEVSNLLQQFSTNKLTDVMTVGENGIATIFLMFSTNKFILVTGNGTTKTTVTAEGLRDWKESKNVKDININFSESESDFIGTELLLGELSVDQPLFNLTYQQLVYLLRTKTFIGYTRAIWEKEDKVNNKVKVNFSFIDKLGNQYPSSSKNQSIKFGYMMPYEGIAAIHYEEELKDKKGLTEQEKREILNNKVVYSEKTLTSEKDQRNIHILACIVPNRDYWNKRSVELGLCNEQDLENETFMENFDYCLMGSSIVLSAKGMPTTIELKRPRNVGAAGYWDNLFILIEDPSLRFDIGRKSIIEDLSKNYIQEYNRILKDIFNEFAKNVFPFLKEEEKFDKKIAFEEARGRLDNLGVAGLPIIKEPSDQEAHVNDLFIVLLSKNIITNLDILRTGYRDKYDKLAVADGVKDIVIELKTSVDKILRNFNNATKQYPDIDYIVCWDVSKKEKQKFKIKGLDLKENIIYKTSFSERTEFRHSASHVITADFIKPIYVIDLKVIVEDLKND